MFEVNGQAIRISRGDTGLLTILASGNVQLTDRDVAVFTVRRRGGGAVLLELEATPDAEGKVQFGFTNEMTERWKPDGYEWDVRYVLDGGREVITPMEPSPFIVVRTVGSV